MHFKATEGYSNLKQMFDTLVTKADDEDLVRIAKERIGGEAIEVSLDDL